VDEVVQDIPARKSMCHHISVFEVATHNGDFVAPWNIVDSSSIAHDDGDVVAFFEQAGH
jgi:hypothetical protein